jgi:hypothetical protein
VLAIAFALGDMPMDYIAPPGIFRRRAKVAKTEPKDVFCMTKK